jgi:Mn2+/Fe2+ NRAMP family transporter
LLILIMLITNNREIMGKYVNRRALNILGWTTTSFTLAAALGLLWTWLAS